MSMYHEGVLSKLTVFLMQIKIKRELRLTCVNVWTLHNVTMRPANYFNILHVTL